MAVTREEVRYIAELARLRFTEEEEERLACDMTRILGYVAQLEELDVTDVPPMSHVLDLYNVVRDDVVEQRITREEALANAGGADEAFFRVPKVIE